MPWPTKSKPKVKVVRKRLADGTIRTYEYERKAPVEKHAADSITALMETWMHSPEWARLSDGRKKKCELYLRPLRPIGYKPVKSLRRRDIIVVRNMTYEGRPGAANGFVNVVSAMCGWAVQMDLLDYNPALKIPKIPGGHLPAWSQAQADDAIEGLPAHLRRLVLLALYTGQRRGDLCRMAWTHYDGARIRVVQGKTGTPLVIPVHPVLKAEIDTWPRVAATILVNSLGRPWKPNRVTDGLRRALGVLGFPPGWNVHGLRKLAAANLAEAGCSALEIGAITGHKSLSSLEIYVKSARQEVMASAAIIRLTGRKG